jgi:serralysin
LSGDQDKDALIRYAGRKTADAYALYPSERADGGDAWFTTSGYYDNPLVGTGGYTGIMHETGHALGLKHSFENSVNGPVPANHDSLEYTVMSYSSYAGAKTWSAATTDFPQTLMMDDIAAANHVRGEFRHLLRSHDIHVEP